MNNKMSGKEGILSDDGYNNRKKKSYTETDSENK